MLTQEDDVDAHALRKRGWSISAIARHLGHDRKTIRVYLNGDRVAGVRAPAGASGFDVYAEYCRERLLEDPHLWAMTLFDEIVALGFVQSYPTFTRQLRQRSLRPACERCSAAKGRPVAIIDHPAGDETQWDWVDLPDPPAAWGRSRRRLVRPGCAHGSSSGCAANVQLKHQTREPGPVDHDAVLAFEGGFDLAGSVDLVVVDEDLSDRHFQLVVFETSCTDRAGKRGAH